MVVTITVFKSIVRHHYSTVRPHSYLTCTCNDVFNCDARNYLLIWISNKGSKIVYFILSISEDKDHCLILRWQWYCIKNRYHARLFTMYPMLICLSWLDISRFSHSLFPLYHISQLKSRCMISMSLQRWQLINLLYKSVHQVDFLHSWIIAHFW